MDKKSKTLFSILLGAMAIATAFSYYRYVVRHDYRVEGEAPLEENAPLEDKSASSP